MAKSEEPDASMRFGDSERVVDSIARAHSLLASARSSVAEDRQGDYAFEVAERRLAELSVRDVDGVVEAATEAAKLDPERFSFAYGRFIGSVEGLDAVLARVEDELTEGSSPAPKRIEAIVRLLADKLVDVVDATDKLGSTSAVIAAERQTREDVETFATELGDLRRQVGDAASEFGIDVRTLEWGRYADEEASIANRWRAGSVLFLASTAAFSLLSVFQVLGEDPSWPEVALKGLVVFSLGGIAAYCASQSGEHRSEARAARRNALDLVTLSLFVSGLSAGSREEVLRNFGMTRFNGVSLHVSGNGEEAALPAEAIGLLKQLLSLGRT